MKPQSVLNQLEADSTDIMCSSIIDKYLDRSKDYDALSLFEFVSYYNIKNKKMSKRLKPQTIQYINFNKHKDPENWAREQLLLFSPFRHSKSSQLGSFCTWQDAYLEKIDEISKMNSCFLYKMPNNKMTEEDDWTNLDEKSSNPLNLSNEDIYNYPNSKFPPIPITNTLNVEKYDLKNDFIIHPKNDSSKNPQSINDKSFTTCAYPMMMEEFEYCYLLRKLNDE